MSKFEGYLFDVGYSTIMDHSIIELFVKTSNGIESFYDDNFFPHFYLILDEINEANLDIIKNFSLEGKKALSVNKVEKKNLKNVIEVLCPTTEFLRAIRDDAKNWNFVRERREYDISFVKKYLIEKDLHPNSFLQIEASEKDGNKFVEKIKESNKSISVDDLHIGSFDIETFSPGRFPNASKDPIVMISYVDKKESTVLTTKEQLKGKDGIEIFANEKEMLKGFFEKVESKKLDGLITYNGDLFDLPYVKERGKKYHLSMNFGFDSTGSKKVRVGLDFGVKFRGMQHIDVYQMMRMLQVFSVVNLVKFNLESVYAQIMGIEKEKLGPEDINRMWENDEELERLVDYNRKDSEAAYALGMRYLGMFLEIGKLVKMPLFDVLRTSSSQILGNLLMTKAFKQNILIPNKPRESIVRQRDMQPIKGGFVKEPISGLHENIAVLDFRSLHPTIMISHNVSPDTLECNHEECKKNMSPNGHYFCQKKEGFISSVLQDILSRRIKIKSEMKKIDKNSAEYQVNYAKQYALKIMLNAMYGNLANSRFRWYSREGASATTAWSRYYVQEVGKKAEENGFILLYEDTDSAFLILPEGKTKQDVLNFVEKVNLELPGVMELEFEEIYKRGIFVTKKGSDSAAKKRYALIDFKGNLKIVGFEYVRRDWAPIAKETQKKVLELVLNEGKPEKAIEFVQNVIADLKFGKVPKKELIVLTQIKKPIFSYEQISPHVAAAKKAIERGKQIDVGSVIGFIIKKGTGKILSNRSELAEFVNEGEYDSDYYINHQIIPAVIRIVEEFGTTKQDLLEGGKQSSLFQF